MVICSEKMGRRTNLKDLTAVKINRKIPSLQNRKYYCHMSTTHPMVCPMPSSRVWAGNAILASQDSEIIGWTPRLWTHGPRLPHSSVLVLCPPADMTSCTLLRTLLNLFIKPFTFLGLMSFLWLAFLARIQRINAVKLTVRWCQTWTQYTCG